MKTTTAAEENIEKFNFYSSLLRKLELIKFTISFNGILQNQENNKFNIEIDNVRLKDEEDPFIFQAISSKYGQEYYRISNILLKN